MLPDLRRIGPGAPLDRLCHLQALAREPAGQRELNNPSVQQNIRQSLRDSHAQLLKNAYFEMLHDEAKVRNYYAEQILKNGAK